MIDKDIEILKEVQAIFEHLKNHGWIKDITKEVDVNNVIPAISRTIEYVKYAELTKIACCTAQNCEALNNAIRLGKELETYKKIAEKLAEQLEKDYTNCIYCKNLIKHFDKFECKEFANKKECIIDWARKEVEKDEQI